MTQQDIIDSIERHLSKSPKQYYSDYYIGITENVQQQLFENHQVDKNTDWWIYCHADTAEIARSVEKIYIGHGMRGGTPGVEGDGSNTFVYCYEINNHTKE